VKNEIELILGRHQVINNEKGGVKKIWAKKDLQNFKHFQSKRMQVLYVLEEKVDLGKGGAWKKKNNSLGRKCYLEVKMDLGRKWGWKEDVVQV
jgi:hypothetical protein